MNASSPSDPVAEAVRAPAQQQTARFDASSSSSSSSSSAAAGAAGSVEVDGSASGAVDEVVDEPRGGDAAPAVVRYSDDLADGAEDEEVAGAAGPRQYTWGTLSSHNPDPHHAGPAGDQRGVWRLASTRDYMVGRSRKSDIRIGHTAPMPYISSQHFRVYHTIRWPAAGADAEAPRLQPWPLLTVCGRFVSFQGRISQNLFSDNLVRKNLRVIL